jgi:hypothetical protein
VVEDSLIGCLMCTLLYVALSLSSITSTMTADASMQAQVQSYAEMVCGTNLKTGNAEKPSAKKRCISGLMKLGKNALSSLHQASKNASKKLISFHASKDAQQIEPGSSKQLGSMDRKSKPCLRPLTI